MRDFPSFLSPFTERGDYKLSSLISKGSKHDRWDFYPVFKLQIKGNGNCLGEFQVAQLIPSHFLRHWLRISGNSASTLQYEGSQLVLSQGELWMQLDKE